MKIRYQTSLYLATWNVLCLTLFGLAWAFGIVQGVFYSDASHVTIVQAGLLLLAMGYATVQTWKLDRMEFSLDHHGTVQTLEESLSLPSFLASDVVVYLGICGTAVGFIIFARTAHLDPTPDGITKLMAAMMISLQTAFNPMLCGVGSKMLINVMLYIMEWRTRDIHTASLNGAV